MTIRKYMALVVAIVAALAIGVPFIGHGEIDNQRVGNESDEPRGNSDGHTAEGPLARLVDTALSRTIAPDGGYDESLVPAVGQRSDDIRDYTLEARCRDPQIVDPFCGFPYATSSMEELRSAASGGDALAMYALGVRTARFDRFQSLDHYQNALHHGALSVTHPIATHYADLADEFSVDAPELRPLLVREAYAYLIAGTMLLAAPDKMLALIGMRDERFTDIPVTRAVCDAAFSIVANLNAERISRGMRPFTVRFGTSEMLQIQQETYGNCMQ